MQWQFLGSLVTNINKNGKLQRNKFLVTDPPFIAPLFHISPSSFKMQLHSIQPCLCGKLPWGISDFPDCMIVWVRQRKLSTFQVKYELTPPYALYEMFHSIYGNNNTVSVNRAVLNDIISLRIDRLIEFV